MLKATVLVMVIVAAVVTAVSRLGTRDPQTGPLPQAEEAAGNAMEAALTERQLEVANGARSEEHREFLVRMFYVQAHMTGDPAQLEPFLNEIESYLASDQKASEHTSRAIQSFALLAVAWARFGPIDAIRDRSIQLAFESSSIRDETIMLETALLLKMIRDRHGGVALPADVDARLEELLANPFVDSLIDREIQRVDDFADRP